ncbi:hypothetical protein SSX86_021680 [Deinandra increscens subsp. villosa]|uniref:Uncharacterized protein n=1 Tax=Deinandra increscens subsp. villosa TaxID=3103831 RepID=A0AAP0CN62_9ASTR
MSFKLKSIKKFIHAHKACRSFTEIIRSKLHIISVRQTIRRVASFFVLSHQKLRLRLIKKRSTPDEYYYLLQEGSPAIYFSPRYVKKSGQPSGETRFSTCKDKEPEVGSTSVINTSGGNLNKSVATKHDSLLRERKKDGNKNKTGVRLRTRDVRGVDERAEDFISKVREDMKLQREQSIVEFQEMLARSV